METGVDTSVLRSEPCLRLSLVRSLAATPAQSHHGERDDDSEEDDEAEFEGENEGAEEDAEREPPTRGRGTRRQPMRRQKQGWSDRPSLHSRTTFDETRPNDTKFSGERSESAATRC